MGNKLAGWAEVFAITEEERCSGFVRYMVAPWGAIGRPRITCRFEAAPAGPHTLTIDYEEEQVKDALPEPEQEGALKGPVGEPMPSDPGIGSLGPLPDTGPNEVEVVEGVGCEAEQQGVVGRTIFAAGDTASESKAWKLAFDLGAMISDVRGILDDFQIASSRAIDDCGITKGHLNVRREGIIASVSWGFDGATLNVAAKVETEEED